MRRSATNLSLVVGVLVAFSAPLTASAKDLNVVLITVDTLRADRLGCYGYSQAKTPRIDALASRGSRFDFAYSQVPLTLPSHASLFSSTYPMWNGVRDMTGPPLQSGIMTLAEILQQHGYITAGFPAAFVLDKFFGLNRGFQYYYSSFSKRDTIEEGEESGIRRSAEQQLKLVLDWLNKIPQSNFFIWFHLYDTHHPYDLPERYRTFYRSRPYDGEVAHVDWAVGRLLDILDSKKMAQKTILILTADHGEGLGEHGELYHGYFAYDSTLRVPLIIVDPALRTQEVTTAVRLLDVAPTILQLLGFSPPVQMQGRSLVPLMKGKAKSESPRLVYGESLYATRHFGWGELLTLRSGRYKYIQAPRPELYDIENDPTETTNIYIRKPAIAATLAAELRNITVKYSTTSPTERSQLSTKASNDLRALGYIPSQAEIIPPTAMQLADPKDKLDLYNLYLEALSEEGLGHLSKAAQLYEQILTSDSTPSIVYHELGNIYFRLKDYPAAIKSFRAAIQQQPFSESYVLDLARAYGAAGLFREAVMGYAHALLLNPNDFAARNNLAVMYMSQELWNEATQILEDAVRRSSPLKETYYHLGVCYQRSQRLGDAAREFKRAIAIDKHFASAHYNLGTIEATLGHADAAIRDFNMAIEEKPNFPEAHFGLGVLEAQHGDSERGIRQLQMAIHLRPNFAEAHFNLGTLYGRVERVEDAITEFELAISTRPHFIEAHQGLALMYQRKGMTSEAAAQEKLLRDLVPSTR